MVVYLRVVGGIYPGRYSAGRQSGYTLWCVGKHGGYTRVVVRGVYPGGVERCIPGC